MFIIDNFDELKQAIVNYTSSEEDIKAGLKTNLQYILIKATKVFRVL